MNYIELINLFWQTRRICRLSSNEADLYYCLLNESNIRGWENPFECRNDVICTAISMSEKTLIDVRNRLQQKGLITFEAGQRKKKSPVYTILYWNKVSKTESITESKTVGKTVSKTPNLLYKQKQETETKETEVEKTLFFPFSSNLFFEKWNLLVATPKWKNKVIQSLQLALDGLQKFDEAFVIEMIDQAIVGEWSVFKGVELSDQYKKWQKQNTTKPVKETQSRFKPPTIEEIFKYFTVEKKLTLVDAEYRAEKFFLFYDSKKWMVGKNKMSNWKSAATKSLEWEDKRTDKKISVEISQTTKDVQKVKSKVGESKELLKEIQAGVYARLKLEYPNMEQSEFMSLYFQTWNQEYKTECSERGLEPIN